MAGWVILARHRCSRGIGDDMDEARRDLAGTDSRVEVGALGARTWLIPDGYLPPGEADGLDSHEAICLLNTGPQDAQVVVTFYLEDAAPIGPVPVSLPAERTRHVRTDALVGADGRGVPVDEPYAMLVQSDLPISVQHSRMDLRSPRMALMTTAAIPVAQ